MRRDGRTGQNRRVLLCRERRERERSPRQCESKKTERESRGSEKE